MQNHLNGFLATLQEKDDGTPGDLLIKQARSEQATVQATDSYAQRVSIDDKFSLLITQASLTDQKTFTCMVVSDANLMEYPVSVLVYSKLNSDTHHENNVTTWEGVIFQASNKSTSIVTPLTNIE